MEIFMNSRISSFPLFPHRTICDEMITSVALMISAQNPDSTQSLYHTRHLCSGFIGLPDGQLYAFAKSSEFDNGPFTL